MGRLQEEKWNAEGSHETVSRLNEITHLSTFVCFVKENGRLILFDTQLESVKLTLLRVYLEVLSTIERRWYR